MSTLAWTALAQAGLSLGDEDMVSCGDAVRCDSGLSCAPWPVKTTHFANATTVDWCDTSQIYNFAGREGKAMAWVDNSQDAANQNFWVFHGCDGAGLMMGDCLGDSYAVEQLGPFSTLAHPLPLPADCAKSSDPWCPHTRPAAYQHPGTGRSYEWLNGGMWTVGAPGVRWPDQTAGKPWWDNMGLPSIEQLGVAPEGEVGYVVMFPWVADYSPSQDWSWFWGDLRPFGEATKHVKAYYDNEPWDNDHWHGTTVPPVWQAYKFWKNNAAQQIWGWKVGEKTADKPDSVIYSDPPVFKLDWVRPDQGEVRELAV